MKKKILYICRKSIHHFKQLDYRFLSEKYDVTLFYFTYSPITTIKLFMAIRKHDLAFCWFGNIWSFLAVIFSKIWRKKTVIVAGGHDVANVPEIHYGLAQHKIMKHFTRFALTSADLVLPVSKTAENRLFNLAKPKQSCMIYNAVDIHPKPQMYSKKKQVLTVGMISRKSSLVKGHHTFINVARYLPEIPFILYGQNKDGTIDVLRKQAPENVRIIEHSTRDDLYDLYAESLIYGQFSYDESFGVTVAEAMAYGCTPVVCDSGALGEVIGNSGYKISGHNPEIIAEQLKKIFMTEAQINYKAIERSKEFSKEKRKQKLLEQVQKLMNF